MHKILRISLAAALISARLSGDVSAAIFERDFDQIETMIQTEDWIALRAYLADNPGLMDENTPFAQALREFYDQTQGLYAALLFEPTLFPDPETAEVVPDPVPVAPPPEPAEPEVPPVAAARAAPASIIY